MSPDDPESPTQRSIPIRRTLAEELADDEAGGFEAPVLDDSAQRVYIESLERQIEELSRDLALRGAEAAAAESQAAAATAEVDRAAKRIAREAEKRAEERFRRLLASFLEIVDDIDRAVAAARKDATPEVVLAGVALIRKAFLARLAQHGVKPCASLGEKFDPAVHEAITVLKTTSADDDGRVIEVIREGYLMGDSVLRPAAVAVARYG